MKTTIEIHNRFVKLGCIKDFADIEWYSPFDVAEIKRKLLEEVFEKIEGMRKGSFNYTDNDGGVPSTVFSRGYNQAVDELKGEFKQSLIDNRTESVLKFPAETNKTEVKNNEL